MRAVRARRNWQIAKCQSLIRGMVVRHKLLHPDGAHLRQLQERKAKRILGRTLLRLWKRWKLMQTRMKLKIAANLPGTKEEWQVLVAEARKPLRVVGMYEEYLYPRFGATKIYFYRHKVSHDCSFDKPARLKAVDDQVFRDKEQIRAHGCTTEQRVLIVKLQAM